MKSKANDSFLNFLKGKEQEKETNKIDWEERKTKWMDSVNKLYQTISENLQLFVDEGLMRVEVSRKIELNEENIGVYEVPRMDIYIGNDVINFIPKGTLIIGAYGRIDIIGPQKDKLLIETGWDEWEFIEKTSEGITRCPVNDETIKNTIQEIA